MRNDSAALEEGGGSFERTSSSLQAASRPAQTNPRHSDFVKRCTFMTTLLTTAIFLSKCRMSGRLDPLRSVSQAFGKCPD
ncbi:hypothetical protein [Burkholderia sp. SCN-KJ]|uniref:hypothetical protein n=1 Tax=Burkholderia sp. SCN-KJ TaxID=2969248 RepID=UPI00214FA5B1|nr:hypothetical protein [Burkholderia sp. SCN-KJ]MCR4466334.1 hypothetical protein [Burkholderia sp. SCN-KJ]